MAGDPNIDPYLAWQQSPPPVDPSLMGAPGALPIDPSQQGAVMAPAQVDPSLPPMVAGPPPIDPSLVGAPPVAGLPPATPDALATMASSPPMGSPEPAGPITMPGQLPDAGAAPTQPPQPMGNAVTSPEQVPNQGAYNISGPVTTPQGVAPVQTPAFPGDPDIGMELTPDAAYKAFMAGGGTPDRRAADLAEMSPDQRAAAVAKMSPDEFTKFKSDETSALIAKEAAGRAKIELANQRAAQDALDAETAAANKSLADTADMTARADVLANTKIDPQRYQKNRGLAGTVGDFLGIVLGGGFSSYSGGKNLALDQFNKNVDNDIAAQKDDIANGWKGIEARKGAIASELAAHGDIYKAQETYRVASYQSAINGLQTQLQQFDPAGSTAIRGRDALDQLHAAQAQAIHAYTQESFKNTLELETQKAKARVDAETQQQHLRENAIAQQNANTSSYQASTAAKAQKATEIHEKNADMIALAGKQQQLTDKVTDQGIGVPTPVLGADGKPAVDANGLPQMTTAPLTQRDGSPYIAPKELAPKLQTQFAATQQVNQIADKIARSIALAGGESKYIHSDEFQRRGGDKEQLVFALHAAEGIEGFRPGTADMLKELEGGVDPNDYSFLRSDARAGLSNLKENLNYKLNSDLRVKGHYDGPDIKFPDMSKVGGATSDTDKAFTDSLKFDHKDTLGGNFVGKDLDLIKSENPGITDEQAQNAQVGYTPEQAKPINDALLTLHDSKSTPEAKAQSKAILAGMAKGADSASLRDIAQSALESVGGGSDSDDAGPRFK